MQSLDEQQRACVALVLEGHNVFISGLPGCGKTFTTKAAIAELERKYPVGVMVVAPTGLAGLALGGSTVNARPGPGIPKGDNTAFRKYMSSKYNAQTWKKVRVLIIDEVSMVSAEFIDWYYDIIHEMNRGIQLVLVGDFSQLPPVPEKYAPSLDDDGLLEQSLRISSSSTTGGRWVVPYGIRECEARYMFQSACWRSLDLKIVHLKGKHRTQDETLLSALADIRLGMGDTPAVRRLVAATERELEPVDGVRPTVLYATRNEVSKENKKRLEELDVKTMHVYKAVDSVEVAPNAASWTRGDLERDSFFTKDCQAAEELELRIGCQVILLKNEVIEDGACTASRLVNGSRGVVVGFAKSEGAPASEKTEWPVVQFVNGRQQVCRWMEFTKQLYRKGNCTRMQVPLMLAWAVTVHKSQGMSIDFLKVDLAGTFADGQCFVACSRATNLAGLQICNFRPSCVKTSPLIVQFNAALDAGELPGFVARTATWWRPIVQHSVTAWADLYMRNPSFATWEKQWPQGHAGKLVEEVGTADESPDGAVRDLIARSITDPDGATFALAKASQQVRDGFRAAANECVRASLEVCDRAVKRKAEHGAAGEAREFKYPSQVSFAPPC